MGNLDLSLGIIWYVVFLFSVVLHEAAHAWTSFKLGDSTAYQGGQVSLDPLPHIRRAPIGMVVVPVLAFWATGWMLGWASAPFNPFWARSYPRRAGLMALAGPAANLFLLLLAAIVIRVGYQFEYFQMSESAVFPQVVTSSTPWLETVATALSITFSLNLILVIFNLIPVPPLDGASIVPLFLEPTLARRYLDFVHQPVVTACGLVAACWVFPQVFCPACAFALDVLFR